MCHHTQSIKDFEPKETTDIHCWLVTMVTASHGNSLTTVWMDAITIYRRWGEALGQGNDQINKIIADLEYFHILSCFDRMTSYAHCQFIYT